jgi:hypothetical protein
MLCFIQRVLSAPGETQAVLGGQTTPDEAFADSALCMLPVCARTQGWAHPPEPPLPASMGRTEVRDAQ